MNTIEERLDRLNAHVALLVERQAKRDELLEEMSPILREVMSGATERLDALERRGWLKLVPAAADVVARVLDHYKPEDVQALGDAIVSILDAVRALTQPAVLSIVGQAGTALEHADEAKPIGLIGMVRASRHEEVQKGMAVMLDLIRHVGRAAQVLAEKDGEKRSRQARLAAVVGPRRRKALGVERVPVKRLPDGNGQQVCHTPKPAAVATIIDGVAFTADAHLADATQWTPELAERIAALEGIALGPGHWAVIEAARKEYLETKAAANIRRLTQIGGVTTRDLFALFPKAPGRTIARIAGTPKPVGCI